MYWYLATPYALHPGGQQVAYLEAKDQVAKLLLSRIPVYSPIVHNHNLNLKLEMNPQSSFDFWVKFVDLPLMKGAGGLLVCMLEGWQNSVGVRFEIDFFEEAQKPIHFYNPSEIPDLAASTYEGDK